MNRTPKLVFAAAALGLSLGASGCLLYHDDYGYGHRRHGHHDRYDRDGHYDHHDDDYDRGYRSWYRPWSRRY